MSEADGPGSGGAAAGAATPPAVALEGVRFRYPVGDFALHVPSLVVPRGEALAMVGPSGSGKSTLLALIAGIVTAGEGTVRTAGVELGGLVDAARRDFRVRHVGLVFQEFELLDYLDVRDNVLLPYRLNPRLHLDDAARERAEALAARVGIADLLGRGVDRLSQGERQRVAVCRALVTEPRLLLADEPTGNLDPTAKGVVLDLLLEAARESGITLVTVTHDHGVLDRFDRTLDVAAFHELPAPGGAP